MAEAIDRGEITLPKLQIEIADPYYGSMNHTIDQFGVRGPRQVFTNRGQYQMIEARGVNILVHELYRDVYSFSF